MGGFIETSCPNCGYCPHCGRSNALPWYPRPYYQPYITYGGSYGPGQMAPSTTGAPFGITQTSGYAQEVRS